MTRSTLPQSQPIRAPMQSKIPAPSPLDEIVNLVAEKFTEERPDHGSSPEASSAWNLLKAVQRDPTVLNSSHLLKLKNVKWFPVFFAPLMLEKNHPNPDGKLTYMQMIKMLSTTCPHAPPEEGTMRFVEAPGGRMCLFVPEKALASITNDWYKPDGLSVHEKRMFFEEVTWSKAWISSVYEAGNGSKRSTSMKVSKQNKITLLKIFHPTRMPRNADVYPISMQNGEVYSFRPSDWLADISNNWTEGKRRRVSLDQHEMDELEKFTWFQEWITNVRARQHRKRCRPESLIDGYTKRCDSEQHNDT